MVYQNKIFSFKRKRQANNVFPRDVERTVDRKFKQRVFETGFNLLERFSGVILFNALYVSTALLYLSFLSTDNHPNSLDMPADAVRSPS